MSHFASGDWNNPAGLVFQLNVPAQVAATLAGVAVPSVTYTTVRTGLYRVNVNMRTVTADGGTSPTMGFSVAFTDLGGNAKTATVFSAGSISAANGFTAGSAIVKAKTGTAITVTETSGGTVAGSGVLDLDFIFEAL